MKKVVFLVLLFMACGFAVKAQGLSIAYKDSLYGVQNKEGDWVINPIYVSIDSIECGAKKYYVLYEELGYLASEEYLWLDYEEFIYYEDLIMPKFHIADSDFFVLANQSYEDLQVIDDEGMSPHPMIFLTSDLGMDLILPNQDRHIAFGGLNFHLFDDDLLMLHGENDKQVLPAQSKRLFEVCQQRKVDAKLLIIEGKKHLWAPPTEEEHQAILEFLDKVFG